MVVLSKTLQVIAALSLLIIIHELGHFTFARIFGIRVDKFFLFFDLGGVRLFSTKKSRWFTRIFPKATQWDTEYGIGWLPLGGYCKINGMVDESMDLESLKGEPQSWEFRTKPAWQRLLVMFGGVLFNFIGAIVIFTGILSHTGETYIATEENSIWASDLALEMGFRNGDRLLDMEGYLPRDFSSIQADLARRGVKKVTVLRDNDTLDIYIDRAMIGDVLNTPGMFSPAMPFVVDSVMRGSPNENAGIHRGDRFTSFNGIPIRFVQEARPLLQDKAGSEISATFVRDGEQMETMLQVDSLGMIGVYMVIPGITTKHYEGLSAIPAGIKYTFTTIRDYVRDLRLVAAPSTGAYKSVGSFIAIGQVFPSDWDLLSFLYILGLLSVMLGVMNLLPIPGLDGGHIIFTLYEMISGRKPSDRFMAVAQMIGFALVFILMFLAFGNDIGRILK